MSFDKKLYWKNRKAGKRGQGEEPKPKLYKKGEKVKINGKEVLNDQGTHLVRTAGGLAYISRKQVRQRSINRDFTTPKYDYITTKRKDNDGKPDFFPGHKPNPEKNKKEIVKYPAYLTNHLRHRERQLKRELARKD